MTGTSDKAGTVHPQVTTTLPGVGNVMVDEGMVGLLGALNRHGVRTWHSCQGDPDPGPGARQAYVLTSIPMWRALTVHLSPCHARSPGQFEVLCRLADAAGRPRFAWQGRRMDYPAAGWAAVLFEQHQSVPGRAVGIYMPAEDVGVLHEILSDTRCPRIAVKSR